MDRKLVSIIVPVFNEQENIPLLYAELTRVIEVKGLDASYGFEFIFIDDGSTDGSVNEVRRLIEKDQRVRLIEFSRNFGKEEATSAGIHRCSGDACIIIDADLQHPPEMISEFLTRWADGAEVVIGIRDRTEGIGLFKNFASSLYYRLINRISEIEITPHATDFRLLDRVVIDEFNRFTERNRMTRALVDWLGFRRDSVHFVANERAHGEPSYTTIKLMRLALYSFVSHSLFPLRLAGYLGVFIMIISGLFGTFIAVTKFGFDNPLHFSGPAMLATINLFLIGLVLSALGIIALYIENIHREAINRPAYVVRPPADGDNRRQSPPSALARRAQAAPHPTTPGTKRWRKQ